MQTQGNKTSQSQKRLLAFGKILLPRIQSSQISELDATLLPLGRWGDLPLTWGFPLGTHKHTERRSTGQAPFPQPLTGLCLSWSSPSWTCQASKAGQSGRKLVL
ncbi:hypothetical protein JEQ12_015086 [Ovis aries]|uniref:Uncharacterized protein n=1 Tax=Ovis aries TaxID=9940 RepID=A0A836ABC2_SHEEP|nr:hypothetical protein JEQ12_015086 [Ovis aries]